MAEPKDSEKTSPDDEREPDDDDREMREWIRDHMVEDRPSTLKEERERAARFVSVSTDGNVIVKAHAHFTSRHQALAYLMGKHYAVAGGHTDALRVGNQELSDGLQIPSGTIRRCIKELRDARLIKTVDNGTHELPLQKLRTALGELERPDGHES